MRVFPEQQAVVYGELRWSYRRFGEEVGRLAGALLRAGVGPGDRVAFLTPNLPELLAAHFAVLRAAAVLVAINTRLDAEEVGYILDHSGAKVVFCDPALAPALRTAPGARRATDPRERRGPGRRGRRPAARGPELRGVRGRAPTCCR